jgi:hypothetical protein
MDVAHIELVGVVKGETRGTKHVAEARTGPPRVADGLAVCKNYDLKKNLEIRSSWEKKKKKKKNPTRPYLLPPPEPADRLGVGHFRAPVPRALNRRADFVPRKEALEIVDRQE